MTLKAIKLVNFQRWQKLIVKLARVTTLTGASDSGKSSVLRALYWICFNRPTGSSYISCGKGSCSGAVKLSGGFTVSRKEGRSRHYRVGDETFKSFGTGVPEKVQGSLNLDEISFQGQHDPPFLFSSTPGERAKYLNKVVALDLIDRTLKNLSSEVTRAKAEVKVMEDRLMKAKENRDRLDWAPQAAAELEQIANISTLLAQSNDDCAQLTGDLNEHTRLIELENRGQAAFLSISDVATKCESALQAKERLGELSEACEKVERLCQIKNDLESRLTHVQTELAKVKTCPLCLSPLQS